MYADSFKNILGKCRKTCAFTLYKMYFKFIYITVLIKYIYIIGIKIKIITSEIIVPEVFVLFYFGAKNTGYCNMYLMRMSHSLHYLKPDTSFSNLILIHLHFLCKGLGLIEGFP